MTTLRANATPQQEKCKTCSKCRLSKPVSMFPKNNRVVCGVAAACTKCRNAYCRDKHNNKPEVKARRAAREARYASILKNQTKVCSACHLLKPISLFDFEKRNRDGLNSQCRPCRALTGAKWRNARKHLRLQTAYTRMRNGFTKQIFEDALLLQQNRCAICKCDLTVLKSSLVHADHNHTTKKPRGILCQVCNHSLGNFKDSPALLQAAIEYLHNPPLALLDLV